MVLEQRDKQFNSTGSSRPQKLVFKSADLNARQVEWKSGQS